MWRDTLDKVIAEMSEFNKTPLSPASDIDIQVLVAELSKLGNIKNVPDVYIKFLRTMNGLNWNGLFVYSSKTMSIPGTDVMLSGIVEANEIWRDYEPHKQYLFFADGNISLYCQDLKTDAFLELDRSSDTVIETYDSFENMLNKALKDSLE